MEIVEGDLVFEVKFLVKFNILKIEIRKNLPKTTRVGL